MSSDNYLQNYFDQCFYDLDEDTIIELAKRNNDAMMNNVIVGLHNRSYGLMLIDDEQTIDFQLTYVDGKRGLKGHLLKMDLHHGKRDELLFAFSNYLAQTYDLDVLSVFNTYQNNVRTMAEHLGFMSIDTVEFKKIVDDPHAAIVAKGVRGIVFTPMLKHLDLYEYIFGEVPLLLPESGVCFIYLMFNGQSNLVKIGKSRNPKFREKTLQGEEPQITIVAVWKVSEKIEKKLHKKYEHKRTRGEWFKLSFQDMKEIKAYMDHVTATGI